MCEPWRQEMLVTVLNFKQLLCDAAHLLVPIADVNKGTLTKIYELSEQLAKEINPSFSRKIIRTAFDDTLSTRGRLISKLLSSSMPQAKDEDADPRFPINVLVLAVDTNKYIISNAQLFAAAAVLSFDDQEKIRVLCIQIIHTSPSDLPKISFLTGIDVTTLSAFIPISWLIQSIPTATSVCEDEVQTSGTLELVRVPQPDSLSLSGAFHHKSFSNTIFTILRDHEVYLLNERTTSHDLELAVLLDDDKFEPIFNLFKLSCIESFITPIDRTKVIIPFLNRTATHSDCRRYGDEIHYQDDDACSQSDDHMIEAMRDCDISKEPDDEDENEEDDEESDHSKATDDVGGKKIIYSQNMKRQLTQYLKNKYPKIFKSAKKVTKPYLNLENFVKGLKPAVHNLQIADYHHLIYFVECANDMTHSTLVMSYGSGKMTKQTQTIYENLPKICGRDIFYLGLVPRTAYIEYTIDLQHISEQIIRGYDEIIDSVKELTSKKEKIPKALRDRVWDIHCGKESAVGKCASCNCEISMRDYDCGHKISQAHGGSTSIDNLVPLCKTCNRSMGATDFDEFVKRFFRG
jgi:hypothetical protein